MMSGLEATSDDAINYGLTPEGDDVYTLRFDEAPHLPVPMPLSVYEDQYERPLLAARAYVEAILGKKLADWPCETFPELSFPLFAVWALGVDAKSAVMVNHRPSDAPFTKY